MSERSRGPDWLDFIAITLMLIVVIFFIAFTLKSEVVNLQRRVGQLEQEKGDLTR